MYQCQSISQENARLHDELAWQRHQAETKPTTPKQDATNSSQSQQYTTLPESMFEVYQPPPQSPQKPLYPKLPESTSEVHQPPVRSPQITTIPGSPFGVHQPPAQSPRPKAVPSSDRPQNNERAALEAQVDQYRQEHNELLERYAKLAEEMKRKKIESFEELAEQDKESMKIFIELARLTPAMPLQGKNIGLFGVTSTGKSTMLNALLGQRLAETGVGETTTEIKAYPGNGFTLWDVPGRNDEVSYFSMEYVSFFKSLTRRLILITATVKENSSMMKLLDELDLEYDIVFNKFDKVDAEEQPLVVKQIQTEITRANLRKVNNLFFVSAKNPKMFQDWERMVQHLTNISV